MKILKVLLWGLIIIISALIGTVIGMITGIFVFPALVVSWLNGSEESISTDNNNDDI